MTAPAPAFGDAPRARFLDSLGAGSAGAVALADELECALAAAEDRLHASMAGDVFAARALLEANRRIQANNVEANAPID